MFDVGPYDDIIRQGIVGSKFFFAPQQEAIMSVVY